MSIFSVFYHFKFKDNKMLIFLSGEDNKTAQASQHQ